MHGQTDPRKYLLIAGILQIVWGFDPAASKYVIDEIPVELYIALRWTISGVIFALFLAATGQVAHGCFCDPHMQEPNIAPLFQTISKAESPLSFLETKRPPGR